jgi:hypothetical protein
MSKSGAWSELDQPLVERLRQRGISPIGARDASAEKFELSTGERGDATIVFKVSAQDFHDVGVMLSVGAVLTGAFLATAPGAGPLPTLLVSIPLLGVGGLLGLWRLLVRRVLVVDPGGCDDSVGYLASGKCGSPIGRVLRSRASTSSVNPRCAL